MENNIHVDGASGHIIGKWSYRISPPFTSVTGHILNNNRYLIAIARLFGFFRNYSLEEKEYAIAYLSALCLL
ncbi:unnamed protein product, partial [Clonostachys solani]